MPPLVLNTRNLSDNNKKVHLSKANSQGAMSQSPQYSRRSTANEKLRDNFTTESINKNEKNSQKPGDAYGKIQPRTTSRVQ